MDGVNRSIIPKSGVSTNTHNNENIPISQNSGSKSTENAFEAGKNQETKSTDFKSDTERIKKAINTSSSNRANSEVRTSFDIDKRPPHENENLSLLNVPIWTTAGAVTSGITTSTICSVLNIAQMTNYTIFSLVLGITVTATSVKFLNAKAASKPKNTPNKIE